MVTIWMDLTANYVILDVSFALEVQNEIVQSVSITIFWTVISVCSAILIASLVIGIQNLIAGGVKVGIT
jgi:hypothetical protein